MNSAERIEELLKYSNMSAKKFAETVGIKTVQSLYDLQKGKIKNISKALAGKISETFPDIEKEWLLYGRGEMLKPDQPIGDINNSTVVGANVNGSGNTITNNDVAGLIELQKGYQEILKEKDKQMNKSQEQIDRLLTIIENISK